MTNSQKRDRIWRQFSRGIITAEERDNALASIA